MPQAVDVRNDLRRWHAELKRIAEEMGEAVEGMAECQAGEFLAVAMECVETASRVTKQTARRTILFPSETP